MSKEPCPDCGKFHPMEGSIIENAVEQAERLIAEAAGLKNPEEIHNTLAFLQVCSTRILANLIANQAMNEADFEPALNKVVNGLRVESKLLLEAFRRGEGIERTKL